VQRDGRERQSSAALRIRRASSGTSRVGAGRRAAGGRTASCAHSPRHGAPAGPTRRPRPRSREKQSGGDRIWEFPGSPHPIEVETAKSKRRSHQEASGGNTPPSRAGGRPSLARRDALDYPLVCRRWATLCSWNSMRSMMASIDVPGVQEVNGEPS